MGFAIRWLDEVDSDFSSIRMESIVPVVNFSPSPVRVIEILVIVKVCFFRKLIYKGFAWKNCSFLRLCISLISIGNHIEKYRDIALDRGDAMRNVSWNEGRTMCLDYNTHKKQHRPHFYLSHVTLVFGGCNGRNVHVTTTEFQQLIATPDVRLW